MKLIGPLLERLVYQAYSLSDQLYQIYFKVRQALLQSATALLIQCTSFTVLQSATVIYSGDYFKVRKNRPLCRLWCSNLQEEKTKWKAVCKVCKKTCGNNYDILLLYLLRLVPYFNKLNIKVMKTYCSERKVIGAIYHIKHQTNRETRRKLLCVIKYS